MAWGSHYRGDGSVHDEPIEPPPPWREFPRPSLGVRFQPPKGLADAVNAALALRRPLLITGAPGSGKSTVIESVADELALGPVLRWHITSRSTLADALYRYDVLGRINEQQLGHSVVEIAPYLQLGPLGTALVPSRRPRPLLIDEIDKSDLDLPSDLLDVLERGEFEIPELTRSPQPDVRIRMWDSEELHNVHRGRLRCTEFPFIVLTSNGERDFPAAFLRRCVRFAMPLPTEDAIRDIVRAHLRLRIRDDGPEADLITRYLGQLQRGESLAIDQLLSAMFLLSGTDAPVEEQREDLIRLMFQDLSRA